MSIAPEKERLIVALRKAAKDPEAHELAQKHYFTRHNVEAPLWHCDTACCIAGDCLWKDAAAKLGSDQAVSARIKGVDNLSISKALLAVMDSDASDPSAYAQEVYGLTDDEAMLLFHSETNYQVHLAMAKIFEDGLRIPAIDEDFVFDGSYLNSELLCNDSLSGKAIAVSPSQVEQYLRGFAVQGA